MQILPVRLSGGGRLEDVLSSICNRWNNLSVGRFSVSYAYEDGYCALQNESDFENILFLFSNCDRINAKVDENKHSSRLIVGSTIDEVGDVDEVVDDELEYVDRMDPAEKYCKHAETRYLTKAWADLIEGVGQEFPLGVKEFRAVLARYAIENGFMYRFVKNDKLRVTAVCVIEGCEWHVHAIVNRTNGVFPIKKCHNEHNCGSTYRTNKHKRVSSRLVADEIAGIVEKKPKTSPIDMLDWFTDKYGLDLCYHSAWLGLVNNIPVMFPSCHHAYCLYHLLFSLKDHFPGQFRKGFRNRLIELFNKCAYASSVSVFKAVEEEFYQFGGDKARSFIVNVPKEHWSNAYFKGQRYGEMSFSAVESFNNWILKAREMPVFYLVDEFRRKIMKQMAARRVKSMKWNSVICPKMDKKLARFIKKGRSWRIIMLKGGLYEVRCLPPKVVSVDERTCSCGYWQSNGFMCRHAAMVIIKACGGEGTLVDHMDPLYLLMRIDVHMKNPYIQL
ncbi:hypothetical protein RHGRI_001792 [Rhododendron griersonianum]|uniref:SWIM-type domain-containing protein n=1 Tax=Rhododendron griersonianum TaxID=479676 RepID=A0AAV6LMJ4_9ERIC|nr:hypothetical protein RHGRI_001792 [Rhododendron griersonianum]